ncbi:hypothetical protein, partial [Pseudomonas anguilliseptica]|uniref:hypothetical protein n=1 Tax=Pseudomonas anguilliseptica TaxID=53406 RepID=UPI0022AECA73
MPSSIKARAGDLGQAGLYIAVGINAGAACFLQCLAKGIEQVGGGGRDNDLCCTGGKRIDGITLGRSPSRFNKLGDLAEGVVLGGGDVASGI